MNTNNPSKTILTIVLVAVALVTASFASSPKASEPYQDYAQRHAGDTLLPVSGNSDANSDYFQRHWNEAVRQADTTDYAQRHAGLKLSVSAPIAASDYFQRHPELTASADASGDLTDYFFRQDLNPAGVSVDLTDYYFRLAVR